jgi:uncharacterized protein (TIGR02246 family)
MTRRGFALVPWIVLAVGACTPPAAPQVDLAAEEQAVRDRSMAWLAASQARDPAAEAALFADDGIAFRENRDAIVGPAAFQAYSAEQYAQNPNSSITWTVDQVHVATAGDIAYEMGTFQFTGGGPTGTEEDSGKYVTVWKKVNGEWKVAADIGVSTKPEAPTTTTAN